MSITNTAELVALARREAIEECAKVAEDYAYSMTHTAIQRGSLGKPNTVPTSKADAGASIAQKIRALAHQEGR